MRLSAIAIIASSLGGLTAKGGEVHRRLAVRHTVKANQRRIVIDAAVVAHMVAKGAINSRLTRRNRAFQHKLRHRRHFKVNRFTFCERNTFACYRAQQIATRKDLQG